MKIFSTRILRLIINRPEIILGVILLVYAGLLVPTVGRQGVSWDEQTDIMVARAYLGHMSGWIIGSNIDPSQTRLPAATVAVVYMMMGRDDLIIARLVSCAVGAWTIVGVYLYGKRRFSSKVGLLASFVLGTSPFYLAFARVAFTETDIYLACTLVWLLYFVDKVQEKPTLRNMAWVGVVLGLAVSAKFTALAVVPAVGYALWRGNRAERGKGLQRVGTGWMMGWVVLLFLIAVVGLAISFSGLKGLGSGIWREHLYLVALGAWLGSVFYAARLREHGISWVWGGGFVLCLAFLTFLVLPPEHLTNPQILQSLYQRFLYDKSPGPNFWMEAAALHGLVILIKPSLLIGAGLLLSLVAATFQCRNGKYHLLVLTTWLYLVGLASLPLAQTFYTIPVMPILSILLADQFFRLVMNKRILALAAAGVAVIFLVVDLFLCYPDYNLNGYQWLGKRVVANRTTIGYRSIVQTPSDGVQQVIEWLNVHASRGDRVRAYITPWHIVEAYAPERVYRMENAFYDSLSIDPDYVVVEINALVRQSWWHGGSNAKAYEPPYAIPWLEANYKKVFSVERAFGIEMAAVYQRKDK